MTWGIRNSQTDRGSSLDAHLSPQILLLGPAQAIKAAERLVAAGVQVCSRSASWLCLDLNCLLLLGSGDVVLYKTALEIHQAPGVCLRVQLPLSPAALQGAAISCMHLLLLHSTRLCQE